VGIKSYKKWPILILLLAAEMALVYPAHMIIDHARVFDNYAQQDTNQIPVGQTGEEVCPFCVNMAGMEYAEVLIFQPSVIKAVDYLDFIQFFETRTKLLLQTRGPPFTFNG
jgi:hypothetical protein